MPPEFSHSGNVAISPQAEDARAWKVIIFLKREESKADSEAERAGYLAVTPMRNLCPVSNCGSVPDERYVCLVPIFDKQGAHIHPVGSDVHFQYGVVEQGDQRLAHLRGTVRSLSRCFQTIDGPLAQRFRCCTC